ncbi:4674_t:CDS:2 [Diversispora eburnea]|uniref:4674_t:CDS:1 n=1 Tax=Diversispora eburnea TaxID=1213867 RepID=A0A9N8VEJ4_9GLOM|nr:4674_t:CDS:2 [Diversispora eburnea]
MLTEKQQKTYDLFQLMPRKIKRIFHRINIDGTKWANECVQNPNPEAKKQLESILMDIDFIHLNFDEGQDELAKIARDLLRPFRNRYMRSLAIFVPKQAGVKRKLNSGDGNNKRAKRQ